MRKLTGKKMSFGNKKVEYIHGKNLMSKPQV